MLIVSREGNLPTDASTTQLQSDILLRLLSGPVLVNIGIKDIVKKASVVFMPIQAFLLLKIVALFALVQTTKAATAQLQGEVQTPTEIKFGRSTTKGKNKLRLLQQRLEATIPMQKAKERAKKVNLPRKEAVTR
jgi:hypothetical protein